MNDELVEALRALAVVPGVTGVSIVQREHWVALVRWVGAGTFVEATSEDTNVKGGAGEREDTPMGAASRALLVLSARCRRLADEQADFVRDANARLRVHQQLKQTFDDAADDAGSHAVEARRAL